MGVLAKFVSWKKYQSAAGTECAALSSSLDAQHFRQANFLLPLSWRLLIHWLWCSLHITCATGIFHIHVCVCTMIILTLAVHVFCEHAIATNTDTSHCSECIHIMCEDLISRKYWSWNIHVRFGGGGWKEMTCFRFFANIVDYGRPLRRQLCICVA